MVTQNDLVRTVIAWLEQDQAVVSLFVDTWNQAGQIGVAKFFTDVVDQVPVPYCLIEEIGEEYQFNTESTSTGLPGAGAIETTFLSPGQMRFLIFAPSRAQTRQLGFAVARSLNDAPLAWPGVNNLMLFRVARSMFVPMTAPSGPGVSTLFCRQFVFTYEYSANLGAF